MTAFYCPTEAILGMMQEVKYAISPHAVVKHRPYWLLILVTLLA